MDPIALHRLLTNIIRLGRVAEVDHARARVRVSMGKLTTAWLPWLTARAGETRDWNPPTPGEQVIVLAPGGDLAAGIVLGALYSAAQPAPSADADKHVVRYPDGAEVAYDHASGALTATGVRTVHVQAHSQAAVDCPQTTVTGDVHIQGRLTVDGLLTYGSGMSGTGGGAGTVIRGDITHDDGALSSNGVVLHSHRHGGVEPGGGTTGEPQ